MVGQNGLFRVGLEGVGILIRKCWGFCDGCGVWGFERAVYNKNMLWFQGIIWLL